MSEFRYQYWAHVVKVYDGDTITVEVDLGFKVNIKEQLRLLGIDTPEMRGDEREEGIKARDCVREMILDTDVIIVTKRDKTGKYGRYLATVYTGEESFKIGASVNQALLDFGLAKEYDGGRR